jgi:Uma2 family endonuclease
MSILQPTVRRSAPGGDVQTHPGRKLTEREFLGWIWPKTRAEWVDGEVVIMAADSLDHARYDLWLLSLVMLFVESRRLGEVYGPSVFVRLPRLRRLRMPDVVFTASGGPAAKRPSLIEGTPDLIMEVVSPDSTVRDWHDKYRDYERAGVREYWVIDRIEHRVEAFALGRDGKYRGIQDDNGRIPSTVLKGFYLRSEWLLAPQPPELLKVLRELGVK